MILDGNLNETKQYVPETTFDYLLKLFAGSQQDISQGS